MNRLPLSHINLSDGFIGRKNRLILEQVIPYQWAALNDEIPGAEPSHAIENFRIAAGEQGGEFHGMVFQDSDVAKWLEAAVYSLALEPDAGLRAKVDSLVDLVSRAQEEDGYLNSFFSVKAPRQKWTNLAECHELYCSGHMLEAAVALSNNLGDNRLLNVMLKNIDLIDSLFGPEDGKLKGYPGHQEIELALVRLYRLCGEKKYLDLALYFINQRGREPFYFRQELEKRNGKTFWEAADYSDREYAQTHVPVREQILATGHAVRAMYMYAAMADLAIETGDRTLADACRTLWENVTRRQMYITGGIGSSAKREAFSADYDLPNETAYNETCASVGLAFWAYRMLSLDMNREYSDILEKEFYNGIPAGMSADGKRFFYVNPLQIGSASSRMREDHSHVAPQRREWFGCACCPPNAARLFASAGQYICSADAEGIYIHLYEKCSLRFSPGGEEIRMDVDTEYPWQGLCRISVSMKNPQSFRFGFRIPGWCRDWKCRLNGEDLVPALNKGYAAIDRQWFDGDSLELVFDMPPVLMRSAPEVHENAGKIAVMKGPLVYCLEEADNGRDLAALALKNDPVFYEKKATDASGTYVTLETSGSRLQAFENDALYSDTHPQRKDRKLVFVPYYLWGNRKAGEMMVWVREE